MEKYSLLIADDESEVREAIVKLIDWDALGYTVAVEAENGRDALEKAESTAVDVALTDIKMPFMDGLEMSLRLTEMYPNVKIIILTGFDEFEYAKAAISLNVAEYVLKPVNAAELGEVLSRVKRQLDESIEQRRDIEALRENYRESLPLLREHFLMELMWGAAPTGQIAARLKRYGIDLGGDGYFAAAIFEPETTPPPSGPALVAPELAPISAKQIIEEQLDGKCRNAVFIGSSAIYAITCWDTRLAAELLVGAAGEICSRCMKILSISVTAGVGRAKKELADICASFEEAKSALEYKSITGFGKAIYIQDMERARREAGAPDGRELESLLSAVKFGDRERYVQYAAKVLDEMPGAESNGIDAGNPSSQDSGQTERKAYAMYIYSSVYRLARRYGLLRDEGVNACMEEFINGGAAAGDRSAFMDWLASACEKIGGLIGAERMSAAKNLAAEARSYISGHYQEHNLSVNDLCDRLHVSQSYFSAVFKQETGKSFVRYLTDLRLEKAVELLDGTDGKTYEIARSVGFEEPNYFSYTFKKHLGVSPTRYRGRNAL